MQFEFTSPTRILFGAGTARQVDSIAKSLGSRPLIVTGSNPTRAQALIDGTPFPIPGEPTVPLVQQGVELARKAGCDVIVAIGGGSAIDAAKAIAALLANEGDTLDYLEVIGNGRPLQRPSIPWIAVPTTAGTGAEVTRNAVLGSPEHQVKVSLRSPLILARVAVVDPELTRDLPPDVTAFSGLDALTQLIEPLVSTKANPMTDGFCREGIPRIARSLRRAYEHGDDISAREDMSLASLLGGLALASAGLGAVHGFASPIGGMFPAPHGAVCAALLPHVMQTNLQALRQRQPGSPSLQRFGEIARLLTGDPQTTADEGAAWVRQLCIDLRVPGLSTYGIGPENFAALAERASAASSMKANPIGLTGEELRAILRCAL